MDGPLLYSSSAPMVADRNCVNLRIECGPSFAGQLGVGLVVGLAC
jgi:hypothetical protein